MHVHRQRPSVRRRPLVQPRQRILSRLNDSVIHHHRDLYDLIGALE